MPRFFSLLVCLLLLGSLVGHAEPLHVYIRAGEKTHGPGAHDHPQFLEEWKTLLTSRGAVVDGGLDWPSAEQWAAASVVIVYAQDPWDVTPEQRAEIEKFRARGGGIVAIHDGLCSHRDAEWVRSILGGSWSYGKAKWFEGDISLFFVAEGNPITGGMSNFDLDDEMYYDLDLDPAIKVIASTWTPDERSMRNGRPFPQAYDTAAQIWTYEKGPARSFVSLPGHYEKTFALPQYRTLLLRGIAWAGKRGNINEFCSAKELASLRFPQGGPSAPADELAKFNLHPDFSAKLIAAEPLVTKPIAIDWDPQGRLWVAETPEYPNGRRGMKADYNGIEWKDRGSLIPQTGKQDRPARDSITILTDTDGDGIPDKKKTFYEGLELVTGFVFYKDGVIVSAAPDVWWIRDTDNDGKGDAVVKLYSGLGTHDTHAVINNLRWGFDGWIYATHGYSASEHVYGGDGTKDFGRIGSGVVRFKPDGSAFEQYASKSGNTWGLAVTWDNELLWTQPTSGDLLMQCVLPESLLARGKVAGTTSYNVVIRSPKSHPAMTAEQQASRQIDGVGSFTAAAGCAIYDGGAWPAKWDGSFFTDEPSIDIVYHSFLEQSGVSYTAREEKGREETEFITSTDLWFRPIDCRIGPDGGLYLVDFYNQAIIHNDTRGPDHNAVNAAVRPDRDHYFGRIWQIQNKQARKLVVPDLSRATGSQLVEALSSPNQTLRMTAARLLVERNEQADALLALAVDPKAAPPARVQAIWILGRTGALRPAELALCMQDPDAAVASNALKAAAEYPGMAAPTADVIASCFAAKSPRVQLAAIIAAGAVGVTPATAEKLVALWPTISDPYIRSAILASADLDPLDFIAAALRSPDPVPLVGLGSAIATSTKGRQQVAALIVQAIAQVAPQNRESVAAADLVTFCRATLAPLISQVRTGAVPPWTPALKTAFSKLLKTSLADASLPLIAAWDAESQMKPELADLIREQLGVIEDANASAIQRSQAATSLAGVRQLDPAILPAFARLLSSPAPEVVRLTAIEALGNAIDLPTGELLAAACSHLPPPLLEAALAQLMKRPDWTRALIATLKSGSLPLSSLGAVVVDKLRHYPDANIAQTAAEVIDTLRGPELQKKDELIAKLLPAVEKGGDPVKGKQLFMATCAACHRFNDDGASVAPDLTGMGVHPRIELLVDIIDPNREVDPTYAAFDFTMKNGDVFQGVIVSENPMTVLLRDATGSHELAKSEIVSRRDLGRSLMPEGFEAFGAEQLRDIIAFLQSGDSKYHIVDLRTAFEADSRHGLFKSYEDLKDTVTFKRFGSVKVDDVPFVLADPGVNGSGKNVIVLKGGEGFAKSYPQKVEVAVGHIPATALNILGGVGGWAFPCCGDEKGDGLPAAKVTVFYEGGVSEELVFKNGVEFADFAGAYNVPGSKSAKELVAAGQVRMIRAPLAKGGVIEKIVLESFDNRVAPLFVAITAENDPPKPTPAAK